MNLPSTAPHGRPILLLFLALLQNAMFGGVLFGWASIDRSLLVADPLHGGAGLKMHETTVIFGAASSAAMLATLVFGIVLDAYGPRTCSVLAHVLVAAGFATFAAARTSSMLQHVVGAALMAFGGPGFPVSAIHISNLFPNRRFVVLSAVTGSTSLSFSVFSVFDWLWGEYATKGLTFRHLFGGYAALAVPSLLASCLLWPDEFYPPPVPMNEYGDEHVPTAEEEYAEALTAHSQLILKPTPSDVTNESTGLLTKPSYMQFKDVLIRKNGGGPNNNVSLKDQSFGRQLFSYQYLISVLPFLVSCFLANFFVASFSTEIADTSDYSSTEQHVLARRLTAIMSCGILASFVAGFVMDHVGPDACQVITLVLGQLQLVVLLIKQTSSAGWTLCFVLYCLFRQFLFPTFIANITDKLGFKYFGLLNGLAYATCGVSQVFMSSLVMAVRGTCHMVPIIMLRDDPLVPSSSMSSSSAAAAATTACSPGRWWSLHVAELLLLSALLLAPRLTRCMVPTPDLSSSHSCCPAPRSPLLNP